MNCSVQLYTVRDALQTDLAGTIRRLAGIGFTQVEPYNFVAQAEELATALADAGVTAPSGHAPLLSGDQDEIFAAAKRLGMGIVIDPYLPAEHWQDAEAIRGVAARFNAAARKGAEYGIRVGYHNHWWEFSPKIEGVTPLEFFAGLLDPELVLEVDTYWAAVGGEDPAALLQRLGERVVAVHIKDGPGTEDTHAQVPAGQGTMDVRGILDAANSLELTVLEFDDYAHDIFDGVTASLRYLQAGSPARPAAEADAR
ncbi:sugar phosphate isomerase/epimerase family protein [Streptomyces sp. NPDC001604]|uniref:sugar phosphate isomerase/epimerase family protein n=1 Tax=Streptomyces sp. NPDC001604 TaxID=3364593 RepID=UPI0036A425B4